MLVASASASAATPIRDASKPLRVTESSHPFGGAAFQMHPQDLRREGFVE